MKIISKISNKVQQSDLCQIFVVYPSLILSVQNDHSTFGCVAVSTYLGILHQQTVKLSQP